MRPIRVSALFPHGRRRRWFGIAAGTDVDHVMVKLFRPQGPRVGLPRHPPGLCHRQHHRSARARLPERGLRPRRPPRQVFVKRPRLCPPRGHHLGEIFSEGVLGAHRVRVEPPSQHPRFTGTKLERVPDRALRAHPIRIHRPAPPAHRPLARRILRELRSFRCAEKLPCVGLVRREPQLRRLAFTRRHRLRFQLQTPERRVIRPHPPVRLRPQFRFHLAPRLRAGPRTDVAEPPQRERV